MNEEKEIKEIEELKRRLEKIEDYLSAKLGYRP